VEKKNSGTSGGGSWFRKDHTECKSSFLGICLRHVNVPQEALIWVVWVPVVIEMKQLML